MNQYVLRYTTEFSKKRGVERFPAMDDEAALNYALSWANRRNYNIVILWREEHRPGGMNGHLDPHIEMVEVYNPSGLDAD